MLINTASRYILLIRPVIFVLSYQKTQTTNLIFTSTDELSQLAITVEVTKLVEVLRFLRNIWLLRLLCFRVEKKKFVRQV